MLTHELESIELGLPPLKPLNLLAGPGASVPKNTSAHFTQFSDFGHVLCPLPPIVYDIFGVRWMRHRDHGVEATAFGALVVGVGVDLGVRLVRGADPAKDAST